jgi:hypothetical protein
LRYAWSSVAVRLEQRLWLEIAAQRHDACPDGPQFQLAPTQSLRSWVGSSGAVLRGPGSLGELHLNPLEAPRPIRIEYPDDIGAKVPMS